MKHATQKREYDQTYYTANRERILARKRTKRAEDPAYSLWLAARKRAKARGLPFDLEQSDVVVPLVCPVLSIPIDPTPGAAGPTSPSLDRVIPELGYTRGNVIVTSWRANKLKNDASPEELKMLSDYYNNGISKRAS